MLTMGPIFFVSGLCQQDAVHITAILGESVVFNCHVEFPGEHPVPYVLQWEKKVGDTVRYRTTPSALYIRELKTGALLENATPLVSAKPLLFYRDDFKRRSKRIVRRHIERKVSFRFASSDTLEQSMHKIASTPADAINTPTKLTVLSRESSCNSTL